MNTVDQNTSGMTSVTWNQQCQLADNSRRLLCVD